MLVTTLLVLVGAPGAGAADWPTYHRDNQRTANDGATPDLSGASRAWVSPALDGTVYAEPLIVGNRVLVATENDSVYALDAASGGVVWGRNLGRPYNLSGVTCGNINPLGITGTPVVDPVSGTIYVLATLWNGSTTAPVVSHQLFGLDVGSGAVKLGGVDMDTPDMGANVRWHQQRSALALANGRVYVTYGGLSGDCGPYRGAIVSVTTAGQAKQWYTVPTSREAGMWAPSGPAVDAAGNLFVSVGNGASTTAYDNSDSVTSLTPGLVVTGIFAPSSWVQDNAADLDLGSMGPALLAGNRAFIAGKRGVGYLLDTARLGGIGGQLYQADVCRGFGGSAYAEPYVYIGCRTYGTGAPVGGIKAVKLAPDRNSFTIAWSGPQEADGPPVIGGGLVWSVGTANHQLYGFDLVTGAVRRQVDLGTGVAPFTTPTVANGLIVVAMGATVQGLRASAPFGSLDLVASGPDSVRAAGWAIDPDTTGPIAVHVYVDAGFATALLASGPRADVGGAYPGFGPSHGFDATLPVPPGVHTVCVYAINAPTPNPNPQLGCRAVSVGGNPVGSLDLVTSGPDTVRVGGWALDPDTASSIAVHVYVDGRFGTALLASGYRPDIGGLFPAWGLNHGYDGSFAAAAGTHQICAYAINAGAGTVNTQLGCRQVTVGGNPFGSVDLAAVGPGTLRVAGWAIDPDTAAAIAVHVYVDGQFGTAVAANSPRADLGAAYPAYGPGHGYDVTFPSGPGPHTACVYGINVGAGTNTLLACRSA